LQEYQQITFEPLLVLAINGTIGEGGEAPEEEEE
jgi:hypothetical protein